MQKSKTVTNATVGGWIQIIDGKLTTVGDARTALQKVVATAFGVNVSNAKVSVGRTW